MMGVSYLCVPMRSSLVLCLVHHHGLDHDLALGKEVLGGCFLL